MQVVSKKPESAEEFFKIVEEKIKLGLLPAKDYSFCFYRSKYTNKACLIGLCFTDEEVCSIEPLKNNNPVWEWKIEDKDRLPRWMTAYQASELQFLHDEEFANQKISAEEFLAKIREILKKGKTNEQV